MDKIETALASIEDNAAAIRALNRALKRRPTIDCIFGIQNSNAVSFGVVQSDGNAFVLLMVPYTSQRREIRFCGETVIASALPLMFRLPKGKGELLLRANVSPSAVLVFNAVH